MEIIEYTIYKTGKDRSALIGVLEKKVQNAVSSAIVLGGILIAIGYQVDSVTGNYVGDLAKMPTMLTWMIVIMGLVPAILAFVGIMIIKDSPSTSPCARISRTSSLSTSPKKRSTDSKPRTVSKQASLCGACF